MCQIFGPLCRWLSVETGKCVKRSIIVSEMRRSLCGHFRRFGEGTVEEIGFRRFLQNSQWRRRRDVLWLSVPQPGSGNLKIFSCRWLKGVRQQALMKSRYADRLDVRWLVKFISEVQRSRYRHLYTVTASLNSFCSIKAVSCRHFSFSVASYLLVHYEDDSVYIWYWDLLYYVCVNVVGARWCAGSCSTTDECLHDI